MTLVPAPPMRIQLCGPTIIERAGERLEGRLPGRQGRLLFAYLVLNRQRLTSRDELAESIWARELPAASEAGLNALISKLRRTLGPGVIEGRTSLRLHLGEDAMVDVETAAAAVHRAESAVALDEWKRAWGPSLVALLVAEREFLPGEDAGWVDAQRRQLTEVRIRALEAYASATFAIGGTELPAAVRAGRQLVNLVPLRESGYRLLMRALASQGNVAEALLVYASLRDVLRSELGVSPSLTTQAVHDQLSTPERRTGSVMIRRRPECPLTFTRRRAKRDMGRHRLCALRRVHSLGHRCRSCRARGFSQHLVPGLEASPTDAVCTFPLCALSRSRSGKLNTSASACRCTASAGRTDPVARRAGLVLAPAGHNDAGGVPPTDLELPALGGIGREGVLPTSTNPALMPDGEPGTCKPPSSGEMV